MAGAPAAGGLLTPVRLGPRTAANRVLFGPHVTNLGDDDRALHATATSPTTGGGPPGAAGRS